MSPPATTSTMLQLPPTTEVLQLWGTWEIWCDFPQRPNPHQRHSERTAHSQSRWLDTVKSIGLFDTAEGFWGILEAIVTPSKLPNGSNYYLFRQNIAPMWEHEANRRGGKWVLQLTPEQGPNADMMWLQLSLAAVGEQFPVPEEEICGITAAKRKSGYKIAVWTRHSNSTAHAKNITWQNNWVGAFVRSVAEKCSINPSTPVAFVEHGLCCSSQKLSSCGVSTLESESKHATTTTTRKQHREDEDGVGSSPGLNSLLSENGHRRSPSPPNTMPRRVEDSTVPDSASREKTVSPLFFS